MGPGHAVDVRVTLVKDTTVRCLDCGDGEVPCVLHPDSYAGCLAGRSDETFFEGERTDTREEVAAVLIVRYFGAVRPHLQEEIVNVGVLALGRSNQCDLRRQRVAPTH